MLHLKDAPVCSDDKMECIHLAKNDLNVENCTEECDGLMVTSYAMNKKNITFDGKLAQLMRDYNNYKLKFDYPEKIKGR